MSWLKTIYNAIVRTQERRAAYWQLNNLTDKELRDIGVTRGEIWDAAYGK